MAAVLQPIRNHSNTPFKSRRTSSVSTPIRKPAIVEVLETGDTSSIPTLHLSPLSPLFDEATAALHGAVTTRTFAPAQSRYGLLPIADAFTWDQVRLPISLSRTWFGVAFRSRRKLPLDPSLGSRLYEADTLARLEAEGTSSLVMYWYGIPDAETGDNLATCIWTSRQAAANAGRGERHREAVTWARQAYAKYDLERYVVRKRRGEERVTIEAYNGGEVGVTDDEGNLIESH